MKAAFQLVPELEPSFPADVHDLVQIQGVVQPVVVDGEVLFLAGTRTLEAGTPAGAPTWGVELFQFAEAAAHAASAIAEAKAEVMLRESVAEFCGGEELEEDCAF